MPNIAFNGLQQAAKNPVPAQTPADFPILTVGRLIFKPFRPAAYNYLKEPGQPIT